MSTDEASRQLSRPHVIIEWTYTPADFFEKPVSIDRVAYSISIAEGKVEARLEGKVYEQGRSTFVSELEDSVRSRFLGAQLLTQRPFELSRGAIIQVRPDGRRDIHMEIREAVIAIDGYAPSLVVRDRDGNVVYDSQAESVDRKKSLGERIALHRPHSAILDSMLRSFEAAMQDPANELVHLFEVRDAVKDKLSKQAPQSLGVTRDALSRFRQLCNDEPVRQGRHRGLHAGTTLRDATEAELQQARQVARALIEGYLDTLDVGAAGTAP